MHKQHLSNSTTIKKHKTQTQTHYIKNKKLQHNMKSMSMFKLSVTITKIRVKKIVTTFSSWV